MAVKAGARAQVILSIRTNDTYEPLVGSQVELQQFDPAFGDFGTIQTLRSGAGGQVQGQLTLPAQPGTYRYRALFPGTPELRRDTSPEVRIDIVA